MSIVNEPRLDGTRLVGVMLEGVCYGILIILFILCLSTLVKRDKMRKVLLQPIFLITCLLFACISGHWLSSVIQLYRAFVPPSSVAYCVEAYGMTPADLALLDLRDHYNVASSVFFVATMVIGDWFLIYRLFIVWSRNCLISIPPAILSIGALVSGSAVCYQFARADATVFVVAQNWITATFSLSVASNIYSTSLIAFKLIGPRQEYRFYGFRKRVFEVLVQSAALYCILAILVLSFSLASTNLVYIATSLTNPVIGINFCLIVIRTHTHSSEVCLIRASPVAASERIRFSDPEMTDIC